MLNRENMDKMINYRIKLEYHIKNTLNRILGEPHLSDWEISLGHIDPNTYYDRLTTHILHRSLAHNAVCVDVGCFRGDILRQMIACAPSGEFFAFEPIPEFYEMLIKQFPQPNVHIYNLALSSVQGISSFNYVVTNPAYSGLKKRRYDCLDEQDVQISVKTETLDQILWQHSNKRVDLIKIDVEGAELLVLQGAQATIRRDRPKIIFEHGQGGTDCYATTPEEIYQFLCEHCQLRISLLNMWLLKKPSLNKMQFCDSVLYRKKFLFYRSSLNAIEDFTNECLKKEY